MQEAGLEIELVDIVERIYTGSWFLHARECPPVRSNVCLLLKRNVVDAKAVPSMALSFRCRARKPHVRSPAVHAMRTCLSRSLLTPLGAPWPCSAHSMTSHVVIFDVEYVDDTMWAVRANTLADLSEKLDRLLTLVETCFRKYRSSLNFWPWKDGMHDPVQRQGRSGCT